MIMVLFSWFLVHRPLCSVIAKTS